MKGILVVSHGSRQKSTEQTLETVVNLTRRKLPEMMMETAYMEFGIPNIRGGLDLLLHRGVDEIAVVPYFLFDGIHIREDIPEILEEFEAGNPGVKVSMSKPFGADPRLAEILFDRVCECI